MDVYPVGIKGFNNFSIIIKTPKINDIKAITAPEKAIICNGLVVKLNRKLLNNFINFKKL